MQLSFLGQSYETSMPAIAATTISETATFLGKSYARKQYPPFTLANNHLAN